MTDRLFVAGGFAEVTPDRCTVLAIEAVPVARAEGAKRASGGYRRPRPILAKIEASDVMAEELALERAAVGSGVG